jgi:hypothetical protein
LDKTERIVVTSEKPSSRDLQEYITWVLTQEAGTNPVDDDVGERAAQNQGKYHIWFLPGATSHKDTLYRTCTVPADTELLILAATSDSSYLEHVDAQDDEHLLEIAKKIAELHRDVKITIKDMNDEASLKTYEIKDARNRQQGELELVIADSFPIVIPKNNIYKRLYGVKGGYTHIAAVGWGIKIKLKRGKYIVTMQAHHDQVSLEVRGLKFDAPSFNLNIEYEITAIEEKQSLKLPFANYPQ